MQQQQHQQQQQQATVVSTNTTIPSPFSSDATATTTTMLRFNPSQQQQNQSLLQPPLQLSPQKSSQQVWKRRIVDWVERQRVPKSWMYCSCCCCCCSSVSRMRYHLVQPPPQQQHDHRSEDENDVVVSNDNNDDNYDKTRMSKKEDPEHDVENGTTARVFRKGDSTSIPVIQGLDRVVFGTVPAAEAVTVLGWQPPRYLWYMLSGSCCDVLQFITDWTLYRCIGISNAAQCWFLAFAISILYRHSFHRYLVFGDYCGGYYQSLLRMYSGYSISIVLSTALNWYLTTPSKNAHASDAVASHYVAWVVTLLWTGVVNYFILKKLWTFGGKTTTALVVPSPSNLTTTARSATTNKSMASPIAAITTIDKTQSP